MRTLDVRKISRYACLALAAFGSMSMVSGTPMSSAEPMESGLVPSVADSGVSAVEPVLALVPAPAPTSHDSLRAEASLADTAVRRPLERYLGQYSADRVLVRRISRAVVRESRRQGVPPSLITAVLLTENTTLKLGARSSVGAQGLMQVMPFHAGALLCRSDNLVDVDSNICHGTLILARNLQATRTASAALLRYNGCVRGTNTPDCHRYPRRVLGRASEVRRQILEETGALDAAAPAAPISLAQR